MRYRTFTGNTEYGKALVEALEKKDMTNTDLCVETGVSLSTLHKIIRGLGSHTSKTTKRIAKVLPELEKFVVED